MSRSTGKASCQAPIDAVLANGTPLDATTDFDVAVLSGGNALVGVADRAGCSVPRVPGR